MQFSTRRVRIWGKEVMSKLSSVLIRDAVVGDVPAIHGLIGELADYEKLRHEFVGDAATLSEHLFGEHRYAWALVAEEEGMVIGFALYFFNYSTFLCRPGIYLEDLYVQLAHRRRGIGLRLLTSWRARRGAGLWAGWNGRCWTGIRRRLRSTSQLGALPMDEWTTFRLDR